MDETELQRALDSLDPATRTLVAEVDLGNEASEFLASQIGKYLIGCAHMEIADAQMKLSTVHPWRRRRVQELQNQIWRAKSLINWLRDLIIAGKSAEKALQEVDHER